MDLALMLSIEMSLGPSVLFASSQRPDAAKGKQVGEVRRIGKTTEVRGMVCQDMLCFPLPRRFLTFAVGGDISEEARVPVINFRVSAGHKHQ